MIVFLLVYRVSIAQTLPKNNLEKPIVSDSIIQVDSTNFRELKLNFPKKKGDIESTINYTATDSIVMDVISKRIYLYGKTKVVYGDISLVSERMEIDWKNNTMMAYGLEDSATGKRIGTPIFKDKNETFVAKKIIYNFKSKKGIIYDVVTQQGEGYIHGEKIKKSESDEMYVSSARYTTCNLPHPHFEINATKIKVIPNKRIITGPFNIRVQSIPTPLGFLFGIFPTPKEKAGGLIFPQYGTSADRGFFFRNGGYYFPVNDYLGIKAMGEIYTNGSWGLNIVNDYKVRYRFDGELTLRYNNRIQDETQRSIKDFWLGWRHRPAPRNGQSFNAELNLGTSSFNKNNSYSRNDFLQNTFRSNVSYFKTIKKTPFSYSIAASSDMNTNTNEQNYNLPEANFAMQRIYPVKKILKSTKNNWYNNINVGYNFNVKNTVSNSKRSYNYEGKILRDTILPFKPENQDLLLQRMNNGGRHSIPLSTTIKVLKYFTLNPSFNYEELWYLKKYNFRWDDSLNAVQYQDTLNGLTRLGSYNAGASLVTRVYGTIFVRKAGIEAIRHVLMPTISFNYRPDYSKNPNIYQRIDYIDKVDSTNRTIYQSKYGNSLFGTPGAGQVGNIGFGLNNTFEMKVKNRKDTANPFKKIMLLDNLSFNGAYNVLADSLKLSMITVSARTTIARFLNINFSSQLDPYRYELDSAKGLTNYQRRVDDYKISNGDGLAALQNMFISVSASLRPTTKPQPTPSNIPASELADIRNNPERYIDFKIPWNLNLGYNMNFTKIGYNTPTVQQTVTAGGDLSLSETWKLTVNTGLDFKTLKPTYTQINIYKNLHCWEMRFSVIPTGTRASVTFSINVKASTLQDLKLSRNRDWYDN